MKTAAKAAKDTASEISKLGASTDKAVKQADASLSKLTSSLQNLRREAAKPIDLKVKVDESALYKVRQTFSQLRQEGDRGATFKLTADTSGAQDVKRVLQDLRSDAANGATFALKADSSGAQGATTTIQSIRSDANNGAILKIIADASGVDGAATKIDVVKSKADSGATFVVRSDVSGLDEAEARVSSLASTVQGLNDKTVNIKTENSGILSTIAQIGVASKAADTLGSKNVKLNIDASAASKIPTLLGDALTPLTQMQSIMTAIAVVTLPTLIAAAGAAGSAIAVLGTGAAALGVGLGAGLAGAAAIGLGAVSALGAGAYAAGGLMAQAAANALLLGDSFGTIAGEVKAAEDQLKAADELISRMPAGTAAAAAAQDRLAIAQKYQSDATQIQVEWWNKYGAAANELQTEVNGLRKEFVTLTSDLGGQLIPLMSEFANVGISMMPMMVEPLQAIVDGVNAVGDSFLDFITSAQGLSDIENVLHLLGTAGGTAAAVLADGFTVALQVVQPLLPVLESLLPAISDVTFAMAEWATSAEGVSQISQAWDYLIGTADILYQSVTNVVDVFVAFGKAMQEAGLIDQMVGGFYGMTESLRTMSLEGEKANSSITGFLEATGPILTAAGEAAGSLATEVLRVVGAITTMQSEATGNLIMVDLFNSIGEAARPLGDLLINTFRDLGPVLADLIPDLAELAKIFLGSTPEIKIFLETIDFLAESFNALPDSMQATIARVASLGILFGTVAKGSGLTDLTSGIADLYLKFRLLQGMKNLGLISSLPADIAAAAAAIAPFVATIAGLAAIGAIAIDISYHWPDIQADFSAAQAEAQEGGSGVAASFMAGLSAGIDATTIGSTIFAAVDGLNAYIEENMAPGPSLTEIIFGPDTLADAQSGIPNIINQALEILKSAWSSVTSWLSSLGGEVGGYLSSAWESLKSAGSELGSVLSGAFTSAKETVSGAVSSLIDGIVSYFSDLPTNLGTTLGTIAGTIAGTLVNAGSAVGSAASSLVSTIVGFFTALPGNIASALTTIGEVVGGAILMGASAVGSAATSLVSTIVGFFSSLPENIGSILSTVGSTLSGWASTAGQFLSGLPSAIGSALSSLRTTITSALAGVSTTIGEFFSTAFSQGPTIVSQMVTDVVSYVASLPGKIVEALSSFVSSFTGAFWQAYNEVVGQSIVPDMVNEIVEWIASIPSRVLGVLGDAASWLITPFQTAWTALTEWMAGLVPEVNLLDVLMGAVETGGDIASSILTTLQGAWTSVTEWLAGLVPEISLWDVLMGAAESGGDLVSGILETLGGVWTSITEWLGGLVPEISLWDVIMGAVESGGDIVTGILETLGGVWTSITEWLGGLVPEINLFDVIMGAVESGGDLAAGILESLAGVWDSITEWMAGLVPDVPLMDIILGVAGGEDLTSVTQPVLDALDSLWTKVQEVWEQIKTTVTDAMTAIGEAVSSGWSTVTTTLTDGLTSLYDTWTGYFGAEGTLVTAVSEFFSSLIETYWTPYFGADGTLITAVSEFFTSLIDTYWTPYFGADGTLITAISDFFTSLVETYWTPYFGTDGTLLTAISEFFTYLIDTYWTPYFGADGTLITAISDFFTSLIDTYWTPYFGTDGTLLTAISDFFTYLIETYWTPYFGADGTLITAISDFFTSLVDTYWTPYFGTDGTLLTAISDFFTYLVDTYWTPYFGTDGSLITTISDFFTSLYDDYFAYYLGSDGTVVTTVQEAWDAILTGAEEFVKGFYNTVGQGIADGINAAIGFLNELISAIDQVLEAIHVSTIGVTLEEVSFSAMEHGGVVGMAKGGSRGGKGTQGANSRLIEWNEQANGVEYWIATGDSNKRKQQGLLAGAAGELGLGVVPMASGGYMSAGGPVVTADTGLWSADVEPIVEDIQSLFGVNATTYAGHGALHLYPNVETNVADFWTDNETLHGQITDYIWSKYGGVLDTMISWGWLWGPGGSMPDPSDDHYDHVHAGFFGDGGGMINGGPGGQGGTIGSLISGLISMAKGMWDGLVNALDFNIGEGPLWSGIGEFLKTLPEKAWQFVSANQPMGRIGGGPIDLSSIGSDVLDVARAGVEQMGWGADALAALEELWMNESGWDASAVNPDSGAYGIPQINPGAWGYPAPIGDAVEQIEWGLEYIADRYGDPVSALEHWTEFGSYAKGGSTDSRIYRASDSTIYTSVGGTHIGNKRPTKRVGGSSGEHSAGPKNAPKNVRKGKRVNNREEEPGMFGGGILGMLSGGVMGLWNMAKGGKGGGGGGGGKGGGGGGKGGGGGGKGGGGGGGGKGVGGKGGGGKGGGGGGKGGAGGGKAGGKAGGKPAAKKGKAGGTQKGKAGGGKGGQAKKKSPMQKHKDKQRKHRRDKKAKDHAKNKKRRDKEVNKACKNCEGGGGTSSDSDSSSSSLSSVSGGKKNKKSKSSSSSGSKQKTNTSSSSDSSLPQGVKHSQIQRRTTERGGNQDQTIDLYNNATNSFAKGGFISSRPISTSHTYDESGFYSDAQTTGANTSVSPSSKKNKKKSSSSSSSSSDSSTLSSSISGSHDSSDSTSLSSSTSKGKGKGKGKGGSGGCKHCENAKKRADRKDKKEKKELSKLKAKDMEEEADEEPTLDDSATDTGSDPTTPTLAGGNIQRQLVMAAVARELERTTSLTAADLGFAAGGLIPQYHKGGVIPGMGEKGFIAKAGERVLPAKLNQGFERLAAAISRWSSNQMNVGPDSNLVDNVMDTTKLEDQIEMLLEEVKRGNKEATPVIVDNTDDLRVGAITGSFAAMESREGKQIIDKGLAEAIRYRRKLTGR